VLERIACGDLPAKPHTRFPGAHGLRYELCLTREGFDGPYTILYHEGRPHAFRTVGEPKREDDPGAYEVGLTRWHLRSRDLAGRRPLLFNQDVTISRCQPTSSDATYLQYADTDTLLYVHSGAGVVVSGFGQLRFGTNDYVFIPKGIVHRLVLEGDGHHFLECQFAAPLALPRQYCNPVGQLKMDAPYTHRDFRRPRFEGPIEEGIRRVEIVKQGLRATIEYDHTPLDVVGYDGTVYPLAFSILDFQPKVGRVHLPPTIHATFAARGALVCSFVPRPLDFDPEAIPCPYPHASVDVDEVIFYAAGDFTSRTGVGPGSLSLHPRGIPHGPHPGRYEASIGVRSTAELAVMLDCANPLRLTTAAIESADPHYDASFL